MSPALTTNIELKRKLESSPTNPVEEAGRLTIFLIRHTKNPLSGPTAKDARSAGKSEKSILR